MLYPDAPLADCGAPDGGRALWLTAADGVRIRIAHWPGPRAVLILPGRTEYIEKYGLVVADLAAAGRGAVVVDWRGQGLSDRVSADRYKGDVARFADYQLDLAAVLSACAQIAPGPLPWIAHSMGGCIALRALMDGARPPAVAFSAPMWGLANPPALRLFLRMLARFARSIARDTAYAPTTGPRFGLPGMDFDDNNLTTDPAQFARMKAQITDNTDLSLGGPSLRWMGEALTEMAALRALPSPDVPMLVGVGSDETIVAPAAIRERAAQWPKGRLAKFDGAKHELLMERPEIRNDFLKQVITLFETTAP